MDPLKEYKRWSFPRRLSKYNVGQQLASMGRGREREQLGLNAIAQFRQNLVAIQIRKQGAMKLPHLLEA
jgi:hypothetical protein